MAEVILTLNAGSSSIKFALFKIDDQALHQVTTGQIEAITTAPHLIAKDRDGKVIVEQQWPARTQQTYEDFLHQLLCWIDDHLKNDRLIAAGHRVVHGGARFNTPVLISPEVIAALEQLVPLAPLHQPHHIAAIQAITQARPALPQVACFDTAFHHGHTPVVDRFGLPRELEQSAGVKRYGFHGLSYEYIAGVLRERAPALAQGRVIAAHLGNGASLCAMNNGRSIDTTMGFTALDGLVMGTRCGALDAGVVLFLLQQHDMTPDALQDLLYNRSGLLGVSSLSSDMRTLLASDDPNAINAVELFTFRIAREIGALMMTLGRLEGIVFTAGIGEHAIEIRRQVCERIAWLGVTLDHAANQRNDPCISTAESSIQVWVIPTNEERMIAQHTLALMNKAHSAS